MTNLRIGPADVGGPTRYDALITTLGFEERCTHVARRIEERAAHILALDYQSEPIHSYEDNTEYFERFEVVREPELALRKVVAGLIDDLRQSLPIDAVGDERPVARIAVDISSMDRDRLARIVLACTVDQVEPLDIDFFYSFGAFDHNLVGSEGAVLVNRPVDGLEGWSTMPDSQLVCVLGLGFESRLATAALETLEPASTVAMLPEGEDPRYEVIVRERNAELFAAGTIEALDPYHVGDIPQTVLNLDASVSAWSRDSRVVLVPLGPKPFALASILVGIAHPTNVTVWRLSADEGRDREDRKATGTVVGMSVSIQP